MRQISLTLLPLLAITWAWASTAHAGVLTPPRLLRVVRPYDVRHYRLQMRLDPRTGAYQITTAITFQVTAPMSVLELDAVGLQINGAFLVQNPGPEPHSGEPARRRAASLSFVVRNNRADEIQGTVAVTLPLRLTAGAEATVEIDSTATARREQSGFFAVTDPDHPRRGPIYLTHLEPLGARRFFPCHDDPADKATFEIAVETDARMRVLANGRRLGDQPLPGGQHQVRYAMIRPISTYLVTVAVGSFDEDTLDDGGVPLSTYLVRAQPDASAFALRAARDAMRSMGRFLDVPFPFERYGQIEAPSYPVAGLEGASLSVLARSGMLLPAPDAQQSRIRILNLVAHEVAHQWFGDLVTMRWWDDVWLNEALASYAAGRFLHERIGVEPMQVRAYAEMQDAYFRMDRGPRSHPISNRELSTLEDAFDAITYAKGAQVLRMIEELLGEERMAAGLSEYLRRYAYRNATGADFLQTLAQAQTGLPAPPRKGPLAVPDTPINDFARAWLESRGHPILTVGFRYDAVRKLTLLSVKQRPSHAGDEVLWHVRLPVSVQRRGAGRFSIEAVVALNKAEGTFAVPTPQAPEWVSWNRGGLALVELEPQGVPESSLALAAQSDSDPTSRLQALFLLVRGAPGDKTDKGLAGLSAAAEEAVTRALQADPSSNVRYYLARRLARQRGQLPVGLARAVLQVAQAPGGIDPADPLAAALSRAGAVELLGRTPLPEAGQLLAAMLKNPALPFDLVGPAAEGLARRGDDQAVQALALGVGVQSARGSVYGARVLSAYGAIGDPRHLPEVVKVIRKSASQPAVIGEVLRALCDNDVLRKSPQLPAVIAELVLGNPQLDEDQQARALMAVEGLRTKEVRAVLESVRQRARAARIRTLANLFLSRTFS